MVYRVSSVFISDLNSSAIGYYQLRILKMIRVDRPCDSPILIKEACVTM